MHHKRTWGRTILVSSLAAILSVISQFPELPAQPIPGLLPTQKPKRDLWVQCVRNIEGPAKDSLPTLIFDSRTGGFRTAKYNVEPTAYCDGCVEVLTHYGNRAFFRLEDWLAQLPMMASWLKELGVAGQENRTLELLPMACSSKRKLIVFDGTVTKWMENIPDSLMKPTHKGIVEGHPIGAFYLLCDLSPGGLTIVLDTITSPKGSHKYLCDLAISSDDRYVCYSRNGEAAFRYDISGDTTSQLPFGEYPIVPRQSQALLMYSSMNAALTLLDSALNAIAVVGIDLGCSPFTAIALSDSAFIVSGIRRMDEEWYGSACAYLIDFNDKSICRLYREMGAYDFVAAGWTHQTPPPQTTDESR